MMYKKDKVSIIIPTYNQVKFISRAVESAILQDYDNLEIIISDDCSNDGTKEKVGKYLNNTKIKYHSNNKNIGRVGNYRLALYELAEGDWAINLDGDDYFTDNSYIKRTMEDIKHFGNKIVFAQAGHYFKKKEQSIAESIICVPNISKEKMLMTGIEYFFNFFNIKHFSHLSTLYNRKLALKIGFYQHNIISTDKESFLRLALLGNVLLIKKPVAVWIQHGKNITKNANLKMKVKNMLYITEAYNFAKNLDLDKKRLDKWSAFSFNYELVSIANDVLLSIKKSEKDIISFREFVSFYWEKRKYLFTKPGFLIIFIKSFVLLLFKKI